MPCSGACNTGVIKGGGTMPEIAIMLINLLSLTRQDNGMNKADEYTSDEDMSVSSDYSALKSQIEFLNERVNQFEQRLNMVIDSTRPKLVDEYRVPPQRRLRTSNRTKQKAPDQNGDAISVYPSAHETLTATESAEYSEKIPSKFKPLEQDTPDGGYESLTTTDSAEYPEKSLLNSQPLKHEQCIGRRISGPSNEEAKGRFIRQKLEAALEAIFWTLRPILYSERGQSIDAAAANLNSLGFLIRFLTQRTRLDSMDTGDRVMATHLTHGRDFLLFLLNRDGIGCHGEGIDGSLAWFRALVSGDTGSHEPMVARLFMAPRILLQKCHKNDISPAHLLMYPTLIGEVFQDLPASLHGVHSADVQGYLQGIVYRQMDTHSSRGYQGQNAAAICERVVTCVDAWTAPPVALILRTLNNHDGAPPFAHVTRWRFSELLTIEASVGGEVFEYELTAAVCCSASMSYPQAFIVGVDAVNGLGMRHQAEATILTAGELVETLNLQNEKSTCVFYRLRGGIEAQDRFHCLASQRIQSDYGIGVDYSVAPEGWKEGMSQSDYHIDVDAWRACWPYSTPPDYRYCLDSKCADEEMSG